MGGSPDDVRTKPVDGKSHRRELRAAVTTARKAGRLAEALRLAEGLVAEDAADLKSRIALAEVLILADDPRAFAEVEVLKGTSRERPGLRSGLLGMALRRGDLAEADRQLAELRARPPASREMELATRTLEQHGRTEAAEFRALWRKALKSERLTGILVRNIAAARPEHGARYVVNIGAHDGESWGDPCFALFAAGWAGVAIDARAYPEIHEKLPEANVVKLMETFVTPENVTGLLAGAGCPGEFDLLKIDIDSFDGPILKSVLRAYRPSVIHVEVNPEIPPPVSFAIEYDSRYTHSAYGGFTGCSVRYVTSLCRPLGYGLYVLDLSNPPVRQDAVLVRNDLFPIALANKLGPIDDERAAYLRQPPLQGTFRDIGVDSRRWRDIEDRQVLFREIWDALCKASIARCGQVLPFHLSIAEGGAEGASEDMSRNVA